MTHSSTDTSYEAIKHQTTIARFDDSLDKKGTVAIDPWLSDHLCTSQFPKTFGIVRITET